MTIEQAESLRLKLSIPQARIDMLWLYREAQREAERRTEGKR